MHHLTLSATSSDSDQLIFSIVAVVIVVVAAVAVLAVRMLLLYVHTIPYVPSVPHHRLYLSVERLQNWWSGCRGESEEWFVVWIR